MKILRKSLILVLIILVLLLLVWSLWANTALVLSQLCIVNPNIPSAFDGFRIVQISDLHNTQFGDRNETLLTLLESTRPDIILITGDLLDSRRTDLEAAVHFVRESVRIAPTYFAPGNHESRLPEEYEALKAAMTDAGVTVLENASVQVTRQDAAITVTGLMDPAFAALGWPELSAVLPELTSESYQIVLSHRPELLQLYAEHHLDLVFTGHAHGGQFRLPWVGGLYAPHQGFFPKYTSGVYTMENTSMVVSRGLGNSLFPLRFHNRPELLLVTLKAA